MADNEVPTENIVEAIMKDPMKRNMLLKFLNKEKNGFKAYKKNEENSNQTTPKKNNRLLHCESPTALLRRRALEKDNASDSSSSEKSEVRTAPVGPKLPFEELLKGVKAYVEIIRNGVDKSSGIKTVMQLMGATIRDSFTKDVTHVVFKDGSFTTFQKAKLLKVHLVSVLWIDAVRKSETRVSEKYYPAFGSNVSDEHVSALCSQLSKEFEDVVKDEKRRSMSDLSLQSIKENNKNRRKTTIIPQSQTETSNNINSVNKDKIITDANDSDSITSDDSDCVIIDGEASKRQSFGFIEDSLIGERVATAESSFNGVEKNATKSSITDMELTDNISTNIETPKSTNKSLSLIQTNLTNSAEVVCVDNATDKEKATSSSTHTVMSSLRLSTESDQTKSDLVSRQSTRTSKSTLGTTMSSLQLETSADDKENVVKGLPEQNMFDSDKESLNDDKNSKLITNGNRSNSSKTLVTPSKRKTLMRSKVSSNDDSSNSSDDSDTVKKRRSISFIKNIKKSGDRNLASDQEASLLSKSDKGIFKTPSKTIQKTQLTLSTSRPRRRCTILSQEEDKMKSPRRQSLRITRNSTQTPETLSKITKTPVKSKKLEVSKKTEEENLKPKKLGVQGEDTQTDGTKSKRKLYNPDEMSFLYLSQDDNQQREARRQQKVAAKQTPFVQISKDQRIIADQFLSKNNTIQTITEQQSDESDDEDFDIRVAASTRRSQRTLVSQKKPRYVASQTSSDTSSIIFPKSLPNRRSTLDFMSLTQTQRKRKLKLDPNRKTSIACTRLHRKQVENFEKVVRDIGKYYVEDNVTVHTSHLIAGEPKRTINMLRAVARGCWIVSYEWLLKSQELNRWQPEEDYEVTDFSSAVQKCRIQRQAFGTSFTMDVFKDCGSIYIGKNTSPRNEDLRELVTLCQGTLSNVYRSAKIIIGELMKGSDFICLREQWILDSITFNKLQPFKHYYLKLKSGHSPSY